MIRTLTTALLLALSPYSFAAKSDETLANLDNRFKVEVIVFERTDSLAKAIHDPASLLPSLKHSITLEPPPNDDNEASTDYQHLAKDSFGLKVAEKMLKEKGHFRILLHSAWYQSEGESQAVHLYSHAFNEKQRPDTAQEYNPNLVYRVNGLLQVVKKNYYLLRSQLLFNLPVNNEPRLLNINQIRKIKPNELHYIDHPQFGLLVKITPLNPPL